MHEFSFPSRLGKESGCGENGRDIRTLGESISKKVYFAGDAYTAGTDWSSVHAAARSARRAVEELVG